MHRRGSPRTVQGVRVLPCPLCPVVCRPCRLGYACDSKRLRRLPRSKPGPLRRGLVPAESGPLQGAYAAAQITRPDRSLRSLRERRVSSTVRQPGERL